jgi:hypothetical protein
MPDVSLSNRDRLFPEIRSALSHKQTWILVLGFFAALIAALYWPFAWEFSLLCCFPAPLFCYGAVRSGVIHRPGMMRIFIAVVVVHCILLAATLYLWREFPKSITGDFGFGFVLIEIAVIALLMRFARHRRDGPDSGK